jgi:hypothetical protein
VDGVRRAADSTSWNGTLALDLAVVALCIPLALGVGALTLQRRSG